MRQCVNVSTKESVVPADRLERLNAAIDAVAKQQGWNYERVAREAGVNVMTLHSLRWGKTRNPDDRTAWGLDAVLGFEKGKGIQRILEGKRTVRAKVDEPEDATDAAIREIREKKYLSDAQKQAFIDLLVRQRDALLEQVDELDRQHRDSA